MRLLVKGSSYSRTVFINFRVIPPNAVHKNSNTKDWLMRTALQIIEICSINKQPHLRLWPQLILAVFAHACSYYSTVATFLSLSSRYSYVLFEGGYYSGCGFYSNKYSICTYSISNHKWQDDEHRSEFA